MNVCDTKKLFDSEFEASTVAAKMSASYGTEFETYRCGRHFHITHKNPKLRRGVGHGHWRCPKCKQIARRNKAFKHKCGIKEVL